MATGRPERGLALVDALAANGDLDGYHPYHVTRADLLRRLGRHAEAAEAFGRARDLTTNDAERTFLEGRHAEMLRVLN
jgi:RNA polymerase sigma-70 factor (ECF subfamily)